MSNALSILSLVSSRLVTLNDPPDCTSNPDTDINIETGVTDIGGDPWQLAKSKNRSDKRFGQKQKF